MLKFYLLVFLTGFVQAQTVVDICSTSQRSLTTNDAFSIRSENYGGQYSNSLSCTLVLQTSVTPLILSFVLSDFAVEFNTDCAFDSLCVGGVKFCGSLNGTYEYLVPEFKTFMLIFTTDFAVTGDGFDISVSTRPAESETITQVVSGVANGDPSRLVTNQVTYTAGYASNYVDGCDPSVATSTTTPTPTSTTTTSSTPCSAVRISEIMALLMEAQSKIDAAKALLNQL